jgi:hypothetical protein
LITVTVNLKSVYILVSLRNPFTLNFPISVPGLVGLILYIEVFGSKVMKLGRIWLTITGFASSSEYFGSWYSAELLNLTF